MSGSGTGGTSTGSSTTGPSGTGTGASGEPKIQRAPRSNTGLYAVIVVIVIVVLIVGAGYSLGWFKAKAAAKCGVTTKGTLLGEGSTLVAPLMDQWATSYWNGGVLTYDSVGSSSGITAITNKVADFGASDAPLTPSQAKAAPGLLTFPESAGGVVPIYNLPGLGTLDFNGTVLAEFFDGTLTNWNNTQLQALNPKADLPVQTVTPVYRTGGSGTTFIFTSFLSADNKHWNKTYGEAQDWPSNLSGSGASGNSGEATTVGTTSYSIGYVDLNYALNGASGIGIGAVENPSSNFIRATVANTESALVDKNPKLPVNAEDTSAWYNVSVLNAAGANDYPITSLTYVLVYKDLSVFTGANTYTADKASNLVDFLTWAVTAGQNYSALLYYAPLPANIVSYDKAVIASVTLGSSSIAVCLPS
jgi:phosphate transport system substrate-binding protein